MKTMRNGLVSYEVAGAVATITLTNPPANAYSHEMMRDLDDAILEARFAEEVQVILLAGAGEKFFCAGADIAMLGRVTPTYKYNFCLHANETLLRLEHTPKLVVAAIQGHCVGGGLEIALAADIRLAANGRGKVGLPEVALGVLPGTGGTQRLGRLLGKAKAMQLMVEASMLSVGEAAELGVFAHVYEEEGFMEKAQAYAQSMCAPQKASAAVGLIKRAVQSGVDLPLEQGLTLERELQQRLFASDDAAEGIAAHNEKRTPAFKGA